MTVDREINVVLQKKPPKITKVAPADEDNDEEKLNIHSSLSIFYSVLDVFGLQKVTFGDGTAEVAGLGSKSYAFLLALGLVLFQGYMLFMRFTYEYGSKNPTDVVVDMLGIIPSTLASIVSIVMSATCNRPMLVRVLKNFEVIDKQLRIKNNSYYKTTRNKISVVMVFILIFSLVMYGYNFYVDNNMMKVSTVIIISTIKELSLLELALLIYLITTRLDMMNEQLRETKYDFCKLFDNEMQLRKQKSDMLVESVTAKLGIGKFQKKIVDSDEESVEEITRLMRIFDRLADNANIVNSCFGISLLCSAIAVFVNILSSVNSLIKLRDNDDMIAGNLITWCLRDLAFVALVTVVCESLQGKVKSTSNIINKLSISSKIDERRQELLERFSQLMACRTFVITACNFFPFDFTFIYSLVGAVATYTVILLQVNQSPPKKTDNSTLSNDTNIALSITQAPNSTVKN